MDVKRPRLSRPASTSSGYQRIVLSGRSRPQRRGHCADRFCRALCPQRVGERSIVVGAEAWPPTYRVRTSHAHEAKKVSRLIEPICALISTLDAQQRTNLWSSRPPVVGASTRHSSHTATARHRQRASTNVCVAAPRVEADEHRAVWQPSSYGQAGQIFQGRPAGLVFEKKPAATVPATKTKKKKPKRPKNYAMRPTTATLARRTTKFEERKPAPPPSYLGLKGRARGPSLHDRPQSRNGVPGAFNPKVFNTQRLVRGTDTREWTRGEAAFARKTAWYADLAAVEGAAAAALGVAAERAA